MVYLWTDSVSQWSLCYSYTPQWVHHKIQVHTQGSSCVHTSLHSGAGHSVYRCCLMYTLNTGHHGCLVHTLQNTHTNILALFQLSSDFCFTRKYCNLFEIIVPLSLKSHKFKYPMSVLFTMIISPWTAVLQATFFEYVTNWYSRCIEAQRSRSECSLAEFLTSIV